MCGGEVIDTPNLPESIRTPAVKTEELAVDEGLTLKEAVARLEKQMIVRALARANQNRSEAARQLGIGRPQLYAKMEEHGIGKE